MSVSTNEIWFEFNDALRNFIQSRVRNEDITKDILQDVFYKIHKNLDSLEKESSLRSWLYQITRNTINDYYRNRHPEMNFEEIPENPSDGSGTKNDATFELVPCMKALIERLPERYRTPLVLTELEGMTQEKMGKELGLSLSGAKSRVQRARSKLKDLLLDCCHFEFDRLGNIIEYQPKSECAPDCCKNPPKK